LSSVARTRAEFTNMPLAPSSFRQVSPIYCASDCSLAAAAESSPRRSRGG
jgi:hypothetical protein